MKLGRHILGRLLRLRRKQLNKTVYEIGEALGVSHNAVSYFESGQLGIQAARIPQLSAAYRLDRRDLLAWWVVCRAIDDGVDLHDIQDLAPSLNKLAGLLGWPGTDPGAGGSALAGQRAPEPGVEPANHDELSQDFVRSLQTIARMHRHNDFPVLNGEKE